MIKTVSLDIIYPIRLKAMYPNQSIDIVKVIGDEKAIHYGYFVKDVCVSVLSVFTKADMYQIRKFATLPKYQNKGYGSKLMNFVLNKYQGLIFLNARNDKISFYKKFGFVKTNQQFQKNKLNYTVMLRKS